jgi:hypothetical protein
MHRNRTSAINFISLNNNKLESDCLKKVDFSVIEATVLQFRSVMQLIPGRHWGWASRWIMRAVVGRAAGAVALRRSSS